MRSFLNLLLVCCLSAWMSAQTVTSTCSLNDTIWGLYKNDADRLSVRQTFSIAATYKDSISIDNQLSNRFLKALIAVHNATIIPARDTVVAWLKIHTSLSPNLRGIFIKTDSNLVWMKNLRNNIVPCGQPFIDAMIVKYGFQKTAFEAIPFLPWHTVFFDAAININSVPLASKIATITGVVQTGEKVIGSDGPDIRYTLNPGYVELAYAYRWGDCIVGCMYARYWIFRVYNDCSVQYMGTTGDQLPVWASLEEKSKSFNSAKVYPVPTRDVINIEVGQNMNGFGTLRIFNVLGQYLKSIPLEDASSKVELTDLNPGIYFLKLADSDGERLFKIIKQ